MTSFLRRSIGLPPAIPTKMSPDGLISERATRGTASGLRRTLSAADLYSKTCAVKKTSSVEHLPGLVTGADDDGGSGAIEDVWSSIQKKSGADVWTSILSEKSGADDDVAKGSCDVYVHPLVKRSASCLSEKSLEICTESLGSETGSDVGFSFPSEDKNDVVAVVVEKDEVIKELEPEVEEVVVGPTKLPEIVRPLAVSATCRAGKKAAVAGRPLPPPLPSLSAEKGANLHMRSHRQNGRLVLEAVSVPTRNCFRAERQGGRLLLTFSDLNGPTDTPAMETEDDFEDEEEEEEVEVEDGGEAEELVEKPSGGVPMAAIAMGMGNVLNRGMINYVHSKFSCLTRNNTALGPWPARLNKVVPTTDEYEEDEDVLVLNQYVYSWRTSSVRKVEELKDTDASTPKELVSSATMKRAAVAGPQGAIEVFNKILPFLRGCNDNFVGQPKHQPQQTRRSLMLLRDTRCIATS